MDTLRGNFSGHDSADEGRLDYDDHEDENVRDLPPALIGQDERRMQVRAYNFWASLLGDRSFPTIDQLDPKNLTDFGPYSVLLDFTGGNDDPAIGYLGAQLSIECGTDTKIHRLSEVPGRSLLSRITDHYLQIIANQAPIGFEAEFVNQRGVTIMYRGILLPFSSDDHTIDFIYGVINWKELADQQTTDELLLEIDQALEAAPETVRNDGPLTAWADGPADTSGILDLANSLEAADQAVGWGMPAYGDGGGQELGLYDAYREADAGSDEIDDAEAETMELADWLASARELARLAQGSEDRSRQSLYAAIGRAYDFSIAADADPEGFAELVADAGLTVQERAPKTPVVKLVFGAEYDKTRLTEYACALGHAHRLGLPRGGLSGYLAAAPGGLKGVVSAERQLRREENGPAVAPRQSPRERMARKLRQLDHHPLDEVAAHGSEFTLLVARRLPGGDVVLLGEVGDDASLIERAARRLLD